MVVVVWLRTVSLAWYVFMVALFSLAISAAFWVRLDFRFCETAATLPLGENWLRTCGGFEGYSVDCGHDQDEAK